MSIIKEIPTANAQFAPSIFIEDLNRSKKIMDEFFAAKGVTAFLAGKNAHALSVENLFSPKETRKHVVEVVLINIDLESSTKMEDQKIKQQTFAPSNRVYCL